MRIPLVAIITALGTVSFATELHIGHVGQSERSGGQEWDREYGSGQSASVRYFIHLKTADLDGIHEDIKRILSSVGADGRNSQTGRPSARQYSYVVPIDRAEAIAKKLTALGDLQEYSQNRQTPKDILKQLGERIEALENEIEGNTKALEKMPIARYFLTKKLDSYKRSKAAYEASAARAEFVINITLEQSAD
jgi:hypothetical protein